MLHFVGLRASIGSRACRVFGLPDFIHPGWDLRAKREIAPDDTVVFATGSFNQEPRSRSFSDLKE